MQDALYETLRERGLANASLSVGDLEPPLMVNLKSQIQNSFIV
jgi:hypothetical protein